MVADLDTSYSVPAGLSAVGQVLPQLSVNTDAALMHWQRPISVPHMKTVLMIHWFISL